MRHARPILLTSVVLLGVVTGLVKIIEAPGQLEFFAAAGLPAAALGLLGAAQIGSALLMILRRTRVAAAIVLAATFGWPAWLVWQSGQVALAALAFAPVILTLVAAFWRKPRR